MAHTRGTVRTVRPDAVRKPRYRSNLIYKQEATNMH